MWYRGDATGPPTGPGEGLWDGVSLVIVVMALKIVVERDDVGKRKGGRMFADDGDVGEGRQDEGRQDRDVRWLEELGPGFGPVDGVEEGCLLSSDGVEASGGVFHKEASKQGGK